MTGEGRRKTMPDTGTGVLPRNLYKYGARWTGTDISPEQIEQARLLASSAIMDIDFRVVATEQLDFPRKSFDVITACKCFLYFDHEKVLPSQRKIWPDGERKLSINRPLLAKRIQEQ